MRPALLIIACGCFVSGVVDVSGQGLTPTPLPPLTPSPPPPSQTRPVQTPPPQTPPPTTSSGAVITLTTFTVGNWAAAAYSAPGSTTFDHCTGYTPYRNGITLGFAVSRTFQWSMGFYDPTWQLTPGVVYPVAFTIDSSAADMASATALTVNTVEVTLQPSVALFKRFMEGEQLKVETASESFIFDLTKTSELLPDLLKCVESYVGAAPASSNPFALSAQ